MIQPPTKEQLAALVEELGLGVVPGELSDYREIVASLVSSMESAAEVTVHADAPPRGIRDPGRRPSPRRIPSMRSRAGATCATRTPRDHSQAAGWA